MDDRARRAHAAHQHLEGVRHQGDGYPRDLPVAGIGLLLRSLSRDMSREDKIAELDERNKLVEWRAKSRALGIAELACFVCVLISIVGMRAMEEFFGGMLVAFGLMFTIMLLAELFTLLYYNKKL